MPEFEVHGPDPDSDSMIVKVELKGNVRHETALEEVYLTEDEANESRDRMEGGAAAQ